MEKLVGRGLGRIVRRVNAKDQQQSFNSVLLYNCPIQNNTLVINKLAQSQRSQSHALIQVKSHSISTKPNHHPAANLSISTLNRIFHPVPTSYSYSKLTPNKTTDLTTQQEIIQLLPQVDKMVYYDSGKLGQLVRLRRVREEVNDGGDESLSQLQGKIVGFFNYNQHLASGRYQQYKQYPLTKLLHIATKLIDTHPTELNPQSKTQHFTLLQQLIRERMRNCSLKDYIRLVYVVLAGYSRVYKFGRQFVEGLLTGLRREVGLMEEEDIMRLFWVVSCYSRKGREEWEELYLSEREELKQVGDGVYYDRSKSAQYQSRTRVQLQLQILQKVTKRYVNKYLKTQLILKQSQLIKLTQWLKLALAFTNHPMTTSNAQQFTKTKNTMICQLVDVVVDRFMGKSVKGKHKRSEVMQLENKSLQFKQIGEVVGFLRVLVMVRDYLVAEGERLLNREERNQEKKREIVVMGKEWREKGVMVNQVIGAVIQYGNVQLMINQLLGIKDNHNNEAKQLSSQQQKSANIQTSQKQPLSTHQPQPLHILPTLQHLSTQWTLINLLTHYYQFQQSTTTPTSPLQNWYLKLITELNITQLFTKTAQCIKQLYRLQLTESVRREMVKMWEIEVRVMYGMWNRFYYVREMVGDCGRRQVQGMEFSDMYGQVMGGFTAITTTTINQTNNNNSYIKQLQPQTILNIITFQLSSTTAPHPGLALIVSYTQQLLGITHQHIHPTPSYYIRQLQLPIYTYLTRHLTTTTVKQLRSRIQTVVTKIYERNLKAKNYLENYSVVYREMMNPGGNTFMNNVKLLGLGRGNYVTEGRGNSNGKGLLLAGISGGDRYDSNNSTQDGSNLGEFILKCIMRQKSQYLMSQQITRLNKFFTQIKAFNQISFCHPTTVFSITPMFLFSPKPGSQQQQKALLFLPPSQLLQPQLLALKLLYHSHNLQLITIDRHQFLSLHINQRVQMLRKMLNDNNVSNRGQILKLSEQKVY